MAMGYALKQFNIVKDDFIFKKRHSAITMVLVIMVIINTLNSILLIISDHILYERIKFSIGQIFLYQQYISIFILIIFTLCLRIWINFYDINYSQTIINNEWKSLIDPTVGDNGNGTSKINWFIKHKNTFGNSRYWIKYLILLYTLCLIAMYSLEGICCWSSLTKYTKCYYYRQSFERFEYRQVVSNYENYLAVVLAIICWSITGFIRYKTNSFEDNFMVRREIQLLLICSIAIIFNLPHAYVCYVIEKKQYHKLLGTDDPDTIMLIWCITSIFTITQYNAFALYGVYITTIWTIKKNKHWLKLFAEHGLNGNKGKNGEMSLTTVSARVSFHLDPLHRKVSDVALSTFNLSHITDEHSFHEKSMSSEYKTTD